MVRENLISPNKIITTIFTCGNVNGIGPELVFKCLNRKLHNTHSRIIFICPKNVFFNTASFIRPKFKFIIVNNVPQTWKSDEIVVLDIGNCRQSPAKTTKSAGSASFKAVNISCELMKNGIAQAVVTSPISKSAFQKAGIDFPGHTELYAERFNVKKYAMMFISDQLKIALATIHIPISSVPKELTKNRLDTVLSVVRKSLITDFKIRNPKIAVMGLNPHAGEKSKIGTEEETTIRPVINKFSKNVFGPFVPDAYFGNRLYNDYDCTIGMYHDQILIPFKLISFNSGVNYTAGLPIVRTSPDHGTAFDIAGRGIANPESMLEAFKLAQLVLKNRRS